MKNLNLILFGLVLLASCKKETSNNCISQGLLLQPVSATDNDTVQMLMKNNDLSVNNKQFLTYISYNGPDAQNQQVKFQVVTADQVSNGLPIFSSIIFYTFQNGTLSSLDGKVYGRVNLDTKPSLTLQALRQLFLNEAINKQGISPAFKDSCFLAQFGYYDLNITSSTDTTSNFVKAWEIRPKNSQFPRGYIRDDNEATIFFDDGLRFFNVKRDK
ncbi:MAG: hypothetical protein JST19_11585 [Bacteroidetes bacterium]|nr:hypothetical protein [Bacteroidota bacterium]